MLLEDLGTWDGLGLHTKPGETWSSLGFERCAWKARRERLQGGDRRRESQIAAAVAGF